MRTRSRSTPRSGRRRPARPGNLAKRGNEYRRCGTASLPDVLAPKARRHFTTLCEKSLTDAPGPRLGQRLWRRLTVQFIPKHSSGLNQAELEHGLVSRGSLSTRSIAELRALQREPGAWTTRANRITIRIRWQFTRRGARRKFGYQENL